jgi:hypothetical protein
VGNIVELLGQLNGRLYVNSAQAADPDSVYAFPRAATPCGDGSISLDWIRQQTGADLFGAVAIRRFIEQTAAMVRGEPYTKRQANNIIAAWDFPKKLKGLDYTCTASVSAAVQSHVAAVNEGRIKRGALLAGCRRTDCSSGSTIR